MSGEPISDSLRSFILDRIDSVAQLEVILLMHARPDQPWTADSLAKELRVSADWTAQQLAVLARGGFITSEGNSYRYNPDEQPRSRITELALVYTSHRIAIVNLIYSKPATTLKTFADAFRFRRPPGSKKGPDNNPGEEPNG